MQPYVNQAFIRRVSFIAGLGGILYGFDMGVIDAALIYVRDAFHLSTWMQEVLVIAVLIGVMIGALIGGTVADRVGRRKTLVWGGILFIAGSILAPLSPNVYVLFVARTLLGIAVGFTSVTAPVYVSELAPPQSRGMLIGLYQFALTSGIALADLVGYWFAASHGWRWMFAFGLLPALLFLFMVLTVPASPRWLFAQDRGEGTVPSLGALTCTSPSSLRQPPAAQPLGVPVHVLAHHHRRPLDRGADRESRLQLQQPAAHARRFRGQPEIAKRR